MLYSFTILCKKKLNILDVLTLNAGKKVCAVKCLKYQPDFPQELEAGIKH